MFCKFPPIGFMSRSCAAVMITISCVISWGVSLTMHIVFVLPEPFTWRARECSRVVFVHFPRMTCICSAYSMWSPELSMAVYLFALWNVHFIFFMIHRMQRRHLYFGLHFMSRPHSHRISGVSFALSSTLYFRCLFCNDSKCLFHAWAVLPRLAWSIRGGCRLNVLLWHWSCNIHALLFCEQYRLLSESLVHFHSFSTRWGDRSRSSI